MCSKRVFKLSLLHSQYFNIFNYQKKNYTFTQGKKVFLYSYSIIYNKSVNF